MNGLMVTAAPATGLPSSSVAIPEIPNGRIWQVMVGWQEGEDAVGKAVGATGPEEGEPPHPRATLRAQSETAAFAFRAVKRRNCNANPFGVLILREGELNSDCHDHCRRSRFRIECR